jgi:hypothetical protein
MHSLWSIVDVDNALVTVWPRVCGRAQLSQEAAGFPASFGTEALSPLADAAVLFHSGQLAVRLATKDLALLPEVGLWANLLNVVKGSIDVAVGAGAHGLVEDCNFDVCAVPIDYPLLAWMG